MFLLKLGARRQITYQCGRYQPFLSHLNVLAKTELQQCPHDDTVADVFRKLPHSQLESLPTFMVRDLIRRKVLESSRLLDQYYLIAIDGTGVYHFAQQHCPYCLTRKNSKTGEILYSHHVLEAKLVTPYGLALSVATEFIENAEEFDSSLSEEKRKQDCELKAFKRLAPKLKSMFPQLKICLLLDSLYATQTVMAICKKYHWEVVINFKEGSIPSVYEEHTLMKQSQTQNTMRWHPSPDTSQHITWTNDILYTKAKYRLAVIECTESINSPEKTTTTFVYLTTLNVTKDRVRALANQGGRKRWNIEDGFNTQKNRGYELEHVYCGDYNAIKCFYFCLQIAHIINQLFEKGSLTKELRKRLGSIKNLTHDLIIQMFTSTITTQLVNRLMVRSFQIRLDSS